VFGLSQNTKEDNLMDLFGQYGHVEKVAIVYDGYVMDLYAFMI
jgi:RNA recognition motif-containing protein